MLKKLLIIFLCLLCSSTGILGGNLPQISADGAILIEPNSNTILYSKNMNETFYPASTTKLLTALAILQDLGPNSLFTKTQAAVNEVPSDSSQIGLAVGDSTTVLDALHAVLLASDNFVCYDLALLDSGSISNFSAKMNTLALLNGAKSSNFVNPHGYHDEKHYTTPYDLAMITKAAFSNPTLEQIAGTPKYTVSLLNRKATIPITHTSQLLHPESPYYNPNVVASKTGYHTPAGRTLVAKAVYDNIELIGIVMRTEAPHQFEDMNTLFQYGAENFERSTHVKGMEYIVNHTYSPWAKPYVTEALQKGWITNTTHNYTSAITKREFISLLQSATPIHYSSALAQLLHSSTGSIYKENYVTSRVELAQVIYDFLYPLDLDILNEVPVILDLEQIPKRYQKAVNFCLQTNIMNLTKGQFYPEHQVTFEEAIKLVSNIHPIIERYDAYGLVELPAA